MNESEILETSGERPVFLIRTETLRSIINTVGDRRAECGGPLGGSAEKSDIVTHFPSSDIVLDELVVTRAEPQPKPRSAVTHKPGPGQTFARVEEAYDLNRLAKSRIVAVGAGGAASFLEECARAGVGQFVLIDPDTVSETNLATQHVYRKDIGRLKVACLAERIWDINPAAKVAAIPRSLDELNDAAIRQFCRCPLPLGRFSLFGALHALNAATVRHCARLHPRRPAVIFATGPSGVGKTRSAECLAESLRALAPGEGSYGFLRLDMSEYQEPHRVSQLTGAPQGYIGHGEGSQLIDTIQANSRTIVLFDEIEKAHPAILRVLMNAMDAGRLSSPARTSVGREVDCRRAIFLFTSNS